MNVDEARAFLERSENEIEVRYRQDSDEYADIAAQLGLERDVAARPWAEALAEAAEAQLIAFHRHDDEASSEDREITVLYEPLNAARQTANNGQLRKQWKLYEGGKYDDARARKKFSANQWPERATLHATSQQIGVYTFATTDLANETSTYYVASAAAIEEWCRFIDKHGGEFLAHEIVWPAVRDHFKARGMDEAAVLKAADERRRKRIELHEDKWKRRCEERGYKKLGFAGVQSCNHPQTQHEAQCFLWMADLVECAPDTFLSPIIVFTRARVVAALRYWAEKNPQHEKAIQVYNNTLFFGPVGRCYIMASIATARDERER